MIGSVFRFGLGLLGSSASRGLKSSLNDLVDAYGRLSDADSEIEKASIQREIVQIEALAKLQEANSKKLFSPMNIGQFLIVIPFGLWWAAVFLVSTLHSFLPFPIEVQDVPPYFRDLASWLIPTIVAGTVLDRTLRR